MAKAETEDMMKRVREQTTAPTSPKRPRTGKGLTKKKRNKKIQTLKKKLNKKIKKMKESFKKQVIKLNLRKHNKTPKKNKLLTTIKRRKNKKQKK